jgi:Tfp pilus assembly protein PilV
MNTHIDNRTDSGFAMMTVMIVVMIVGLIATTAVVIGASHTIGNRYYQQRSQLDALALEGVEYARARINADDDLYPNDGFNTLENGVTVKDAAGEVIPGLKRWTYVGPTGQTSGQYGVFGSIVSEVRDPAGGVIIRRGQVYQESFAKYAYFTDIEPSNISFGGGDQIFGPVHTNSPLKIYSSGATFHDETRTAEDVRGEAYGTFKKGYEEYVPRIDMPETADLNKLKVQATAGSTYFDPASLSGSGEAYMRIEFVALDLDGDGDTTGADEGFFKVYESSDWRWVSGDEPSSGIRNVAHCGHFHGSTFVSAADHPNSGSDDWVDSLTDSDSQCFLGGDSRITNGFVADDGRGEWLEWTGAKHPGLAGRPDRDYLFPMDRRYNPNFKGVIFVDGDVIISGRLRGRVTMVSPDEIILADDLVYASDPGLGTCEDILGMFSGDDITVADNLLNSPYSGYTWDETKDEFFHGIVLALDIFTVENFASGATTDQRCEGAPWGRGCLYLTGGIIQRTRGAVGTIGGFGGTGYLKRYAYDRCGATAPPPYFPTTGHFVSNELYQVDPTDFTASTYFDLLTSN